jgi:ATP-binding cassette subfamily B (MDR/TAP) protein 1
MCLCCCAPLHPAEDVSGEEPAECVGELRLEHVSFRYPARPDVLVMKDFSLHVKAGGCVEALGNLLVADLMVWNFG